MKRVTLPMDIVRTKHCYLVDAEGKTLGRIATRIAAVLQGKHSADYTPYLNRGDTVIVINAAGVRVTGNKLEQKIYRRHSGYPGGYKTVTLGKLLQKDAPQVILHAVRGMLPKNRLSRQALKRLKVEAGTRHRFASQKPIPLPI